MEFRILGPLEALDAGDPLPLSGAKQRALLAILLLNANRPVSRDALIDALWDERPPDTARKALQVYVSELRKLLGHDRIVTRPPGYLVRVGGDELDLHRFERLLGDATNALAQRRAESAAAALRVALALWRGQPLGEFAYERFAQLEIGRLEELRLTALEERIEADLALGRHGALVGELEALVAEHPLRERLRGQLMLALYRSGRQAEALDAYRAARRLLDEELGLEPSEELQHLERAILVHDPSLEPRRLVATRPPPESRGVFVGRERELGELLAGLDDCVSGHGRLFLLVGEPGIGKSRIADELAGRARERDVEVLWGRCWEAGGAPAYWPWVQALRVHVRETGPDALQAQIGHGAADLAQMLPELRELFPDLPEALSADPEGARFRLFEATASFLRAAAASRPLLLVLDDLHAADTPSLLLLEFLARELAGVGILAVGAFRDVDPTLKDPLAATLAELTRQEVTRLLALGGLAEVDIGDYIKHTAGMEPAPELVATIHRETEGNPLFVGEVVRLLAAEGDLAERAPDDDWRPAIPHGVRAVIRRRLDRLPEECVRVLDLAAVLGREFRIDALEEIAGLPTPRLLDAFEEAMADRLVTDVPGAPGQLRFSHALVRDVLYDELTPAARLRRHLEVGEALERLYAHERGPHLAELAYHFVAAAPGGAVAKAVEYSRGAGDRAVALLAYEEAVRLYRLALRALALAVPVDEQARCELLLRVGDAQARAGDERGAKETFLEAAALARGGRAAHLARAALGYGGRFTWARAGTDAHLVPLLEDALAALGDEESELRVRVLSRLAGALRDQYDRAPRAALIEQAVELARRLGDPAALAYALDAMIPVIFWPENPEHRLALSDELIAVARQAGDRERGATAHYCRAMALLELGDLPGTKAALDACARQTEELKQPAQEWLVVVTRATLALFEGRFAAAEELMEQALALGQRAQPSDAVLSYRVQLFTLRRERHDLEGVEEVLVRAIEEYPARPMFRCMLALLCAELGREQEAATMLGELTRDGCAALPATNEWLFSLGFLAEVAERVGDVERAGVLYELLLPYSGRNGSTPDYIATGSVARALGLLAAVMGRSDDARRNFEQALAMNERMGALPWVARTKEDYARMLLAGGKPGDRDEAERLVAEAQADYRALGMESYAARASAMSTR